MEKEIKSLTYYIILIFIVLQSFVCVSSEASLESESEVKEISSQVLYDEVSSAIVKVEMISNISLFLAVPENISLGEAKWYLGYKGEDLNESTLDSLMDYDLNRNLLDNDTLFEKIDSYYNEFVLTSGTGFIINYDSFILTNAHILDINKTKLEEEIREVVLDNWVGYVNKRNEERDPKEKKIYADDDRYGDNEIYTDVLIYNYIEQKLEVNLSDIRLNIVLGSENYTGEIIRQNQLEDDSEEELDWALLKIKHQSEKFLKIGNSSNTQTGEEVTIIGYPSASEDYYLNDSNKPSLKIVNNDRPTMTFGHITLIKSTEKLNQIFQTDASVTFGNSGSPVFNTAGDVIGIATFIKVTEGGNYNYLQGIGSILEEINADPDLNLVINPDINLIKEGSPVRQNKKSDKSSGFFTELINFLQGFFK